MRCGGVGFFLRKGLNIKQNEITLFNAFEYMDISISTPTSSVRLVTVYRPPPSKKNKLSVCMFFSILLENLAASPCNLKIDHFTVVAKFPGLRTEARLPVTLF